MSSLIYFAGDVTLFNYLQLFLKGVYFIKKKISPMGANSSLLK